MQQSFYPSPIFLAPPIAQPVGKPNISLIPYAVTCLAPVSASLTVNTKVAGLTTGTSGTGATLDVARPLVATVGGVSTISGAIGSTVPLSSVVAGVSDVSPLLGLKHALAVAVASQSSLTVLMNRIYAVTATTGGTLLAEASLGRNRRLTTVVIDCQSNVTGFAGEIHGISAAVGGDSTINPVAATRIRTLASSLGGVSLVSASQVKMKWGMASAPAAVATVTPLLGKKHSLAAAVGGVGTVSASILGVRYSVRATTTGGSLAEATSKRTLAFRGSLDAEADLVASLTHFRGWFATSDGVAAVVARLNATLKIASTVGGQSAVSGAILIPKQLATTVNGESAVSVSLNRRRLMEGSTTGQSGEATAPMLRGRLLEPADDAVNGQSIVAAGWTRVRGLSSVVNPAVVVGQTSGPNTGKTTMKVAWSMASSVAVAATPAATITRVFQLTASVGASGSISSTAVGHSAKLASIVAGQSSVTVAMFGSKSLTTATGGVCSVVASLSRSMSDAVPSEGQTWTAYRRRWTWTSGARARIEGE